MEKWPGTPLFPDSARFSSGLFPILVFALFLFKIIEFLYKTFWKNSAESGKSGVPGHFCLRGKKCGTTGKIN
jgi:hypothetical protein